jgi:hypothetical protein
MACPFAAGAAALVLSIYSGMSPEEVKSQLEETAVDLGSTGFDSTFGHGRVNLAAAVGAPEANKYGVVDVLVTDRLSHPISGASVILWQGGNVISTTNSNEDGRAKFEYIPIGEYGISVSFLGLDTCLAADNPVTVVAGGSESKTIAFSTAEVYDIDAYAITYQGTSMEMFQEKIDHLVAEGQIQDSYHLNELPPLTKGVTLHTININWHSYPDATGYKVFRSADGGSSYSMVFQYEPTTSYDWYGFYDYDVSEGSSYTYYVTAYGSGWETDPSPEVTIDTFLPPCSLVSPADESIITDPNPTFTWNPVGVSSFPYGSIYSGGSGLWIYNLTVDEQAWWIWFNNLTTSSATYNQDSQATPLAAGKGYEWQIDSYGYDENGKLIAYSWSEYREFIYSGGANAGVTEVEAEAETYVSESKMMQYLTEIQTDWPGEGYFFNEPEPAKEEINHDIWITWKGFCEASEYGFKIYRSIDGDSFEIILSGEAPIGYSWYGCVDNSAGPGYSYTYYVTAYGPDWESDPSQTMTIDTWLPPCSLISPTDGSLISDPNPVFDWDPVITGFPYSSLVSGDTCMLVYDDTISNYAWIVCTGDPNIFTVTYNQDDDALPLVNGHNYSWHCWTSGYDENWNRIAVSESIKWHFDYNRP